MDLKVTFSFRFKMKENFDTFVLFVFRFHNQIEKRLSNHSLDFQQKNRKMNFCSFLMRVWKVSSDFQFKIEMKIEKIVICDFCPNIEF